MNKEQKRERKVQKRKTEKGKARRVAVARKAQLDVPRKCGEAARRERERSICSCTQVILGRNA